MFPSPDSDPVFTMRPERCCRNTMLACFVVVKCPFRWTAMTESHSASLMLKTMRSRRMPALLMRMSSRPKLSSAVRTMRSPPSIVATES